jgi:hypothetical protein
LKNTFSIIYLLVFEFSFFQVVLGGCAARNNLKTLTCLLIKNIPVDCEVSVKAFRRNDGGFLRRPDRESAPARSGSWPACCRPTGSTRSRHPADLLFLAFESPERRAVRLGCDVPDGGVESEAVEAPRRRAGARGAARVPVGVALDRAGGGGDLWKVGEEKGEVAHPGSHSTLTKFSTA